MNIVWGTATLWEPENHRLKVVLDDGSIGYVEQDELTIYPEDFSHDTICSAAAYCVGIRLNYLLLGYAEEGKNAILSRKKLIVWGTATLWEPENHRLKVVLDDGSIGYVEQDELTIYPEGLSHDTTYSSAAAYCVGVKLNYLLLDYTEDKTAILSRKKLAEDTIERIKNEKFHSYVVGTITGFAPNGIYVDVNGAYGLCVSAELSYCYLSNPSLVFERGQYFVFAITEITEDNKLCLSRIATLPSKESILEKYTANTILTGILLAPVNPKLDNVKTKSWFFITEQTIPGMVDIPCTRRTRPGDKVSIAITRHTEKGLRGNLAC